MTKTPGNAGVRVFLGIPARLASTRLPRKPLALIGARTMIQHVALKAVALAQGLAREGFAEVLAFVATDDSEVATSAQAVGCLSLLTDPSLASGTERVWAACRTRAPADSDIVVNIQGDEPFFSIEDVAAVVRTLAADPLIPMATLGLTRESTADFLKASVVKIVRRADGCACYFSRAPVPWPRPLLGAGPGLPGFSAEELARLPPVRFEQHIGVYGFRAGALRDFAERLPSSPLEEREGLEQLRAVAAGWGIAVVDARHESNGIDTPEDLERARAMASALG